MLPRYTGRAWICDIQGGQDTRHYIHRAGHREYTPNVKPLLNLDTLNVPDITLDTVCCSLDKHVHPVGVWNTCYMRTRLHLQDTPHLPC